MPCHPYWVSPGQHQARLRAEMVEVCTLQQDQGWRVDVLPPGQDTTSDKSYKFFFLLDDKF